RGTATFDVIGDGKTLWSSGVMRGGDPAKQVDLDVTGIKALLLVVGDAGDGFEYDHADWADARFDVNGAPPVAVKAVAGPAPVVAPPVVPARPKIPPPTVVGAKAGAPFLFTIAALGQRPVRFSAAKLPRGLTLDPATGHITGTLAKPGTYDVMLRASNAG